MENIDAAKCSHNDSQLGQGCGGCLADCRVGSGDEHEEVADCPIDPSCEIFDGWQSEQLTFVEDNQRNDQRPDDLPNRLGGDHCRHVVDAVIGVADVVTDKPKLD